MSEITFDSLTAWIKSSAERVGTMLPPDGDWDPVAFAITGKDQMAVADLRDIPPATQPVVLLAFGQTVRPRLMGVILSAWSALMTAEERKARGPDYRIKDDEHRQECLMMAVADADREVWWYAPIMRSKLTVALGEWERQDGGAIGHQVGSLRLACAR